MIEVYKVIKFLIEIATLRSQWRFALFFWFFCSVEWSSLSSFIYWIRVEFPSQDVISHTWKVLYSSSSHQHYAVFLERVRFSWNVC